MKRLFILILFFTAGFIGAFAQEQNLNATATAFMVQGDFDNAIVVLNRALQQDAGNMEAHKNLALAYYYKRDYAKALDQVKPMIDNDDADVVTYQITGNIYKALEDVKAADKLYKKGLKKFSKSGALYSEYGELLWASKDTDAIKWWEKGIEADPSYAGNYYNAALYYYHTQDRVWTLIYGEIFVNMESLTERATAMKKLLFDAYKEKIFSDANLGKIADQTKNEFEKAFLITLNKQAAEVNKGVTTEALTRVRTRFILDWFTNYGIKYPHRLFDHHQQLLKAGMFEAYNQWLFGTVENLSAFENWTKTHADEYSKFDTYQKSRIFKVPAGQYYK